MEKPVDDPFIWTEPTMPVSLESTTLLRSCSLPRWTPSPTSNSSLADSSRMTASTKTCFRGMSSLSMTRSMMAYWSRVAMTTSELVFSSEVIRGRNQRLQPRTSWRRPYLPPIEASGSTWRLPPVPAGGAAAVPVRRPAAVVVARTPLRQLRQDLGDILGLGVFEVSDVDLGLTLWVDIDVQSCDEVLHCLHGLGVREDQQRVRALVADDLLDVLALGADLRCRGLTTAVRGGFSAAPAGGAVPGAAAPAGRRSGGSSPGWTARFRTTAR